MKALLLALLLTSCATFAEPLAQVEKDGIKIVLYTAPCELQAVINLPHRAEWTDRGKTFIGCWTLNPFNIIVMYFDDKTSAAVPAQMFTVLRGA